MTDGSSSRVIDPASIPQHAVDAFWKAYPGGQSTIYDQGRDGAAAVLAALGCEWDDDQGKNTMRRLVGAWIEKS
jgi:hypothetical protein